LSSSPAHNNYMLSTITCIDAHFCDSIACMRMGMHSTS